MAARLSAITRNPQRGGLARSSPPGHADKGDHLRTQVNRAFPDSIAVEYANGHEWWKVGYELALKHYPRQKSPPGFKGDTAH